MDAEEGHHLTSICQLSVNQCDVTRGPLRLFETTGRIACQQSQSLPPISRVCPPCTAAPCKEVTVDVSADLKPEDTFPIAADPETTWNETIKAVKRKASCGFNLVAFKKEKMYAKKAETGTGRVNRYVSYKIICERSGEYQGSAKLNTSTKQRKTKTKKNKCPFLINLWWGSLREDEGQGPRVTKAVLRHNHKRPMAFKANVVPLSLISSKELEIKKMAEQNCPPREVYKALTLGGQILNDEGKQKIRNLMAKYKKSDTGPDEAMRFISECLKLCRMNNRDENARGHVGIATNANHELQHYFWATGEQRRLAKKLGDMVIQDNTFNTNQYKLPLCILVSVDNKDVTRILAQAVLSNKRRDSFAFVLREFSAMVGFTPKVVFTDANPAAASALREVMPLAKHKLSLWHTCQNLSKNCSAALGKSGFNDFMRHFRQAVFSVNKAGFDIEWQRVEAIAKRNPNVLKYMRNQILPTMGKLAQYCHPGALTLGILSSQRAEATFKVVKSVLTRTASLPALLHGMLSVEEKLKAIHASRSRVDGARFVLRSGGPFGSIYNSVLNALEEVGASKFVIAVARDEIAASAMGYTAIVRAEGAPSAQRFFDAAWSGQTRLELGSDPQGCEYHPSGYVEMIDDPSDRSNGSVDLTMLARTSVDSFFRLIEHEPVEHIVTIARDKSPDNSCHMVVFGEDGFLLCSCLGVLSTGYQCRHAYRAMNALTRKPSFNAFTLHPRWRPRHDDRPWRMARVSAKTARHHTIDGGVAGLSYDEGEPKEAKESVALRLEKIRKRNYAEFVDMGKQCGAEAGELVTEEAARRVIDKVMTQFRAAVKAEVASKTREFV